MGMFRKFSPDFLRGCLAGWGGCMAESGETGLEMGLNGFGKDRDYLNKNSAEMKQVSRFEIRGYSKPGVEFGYWSERFGSLVGYF